MKHQQRGVVTVENNFFSLLKKTARSFYLTIRFLPRELQEAVALAYLLARASDTIADEGVASREERVKLLSVLRANKTSPSLLQAYCKKNFQDLDTEKQRSEKELLERLPELLQQLEDPQRNPLEANAIRVVWHDILEGQLLDLKLQGTLFTPSQREEYLYLVAGCVGVFWTKLGMMVLPSFSQESQEQMMAWGVSYGKGLQLVNILRDAAADGCEGRFYFDPSEYSALAKQAYSYLQEGRLYVRALENRRLRYASSLPLLLGEQTLALIAKHPNTPFLKISRWKVLVGLLRGLFF
ncbi:MAG: squalene/phytoene synthase family protein [Chthoniobacterales bacterium]|nr:squalene/phytoene synthase family protein [Chthoniobacterales bacterium]